MKNLSLRLSAAMWSRVLVLWLLLAIVAAGLGAGALWLGGFIQGNIRTELSSQQISFSAADKLTDLEKALPGIPENAGLQLTTGNQAQAYAGLIGLHMGESAEAAGYPGATYSTLGGIQRELRAKLEAAKKGTDQAAIDKAQADVTAVTNLRNTMLTGSNLRGNLLSAYGWDNVATGITAAAIALFVLAVVFLVLFVYEWQRGHLPATE
jgi:hypothetical protein